MGENFCLFAYILHFFYAFACKNVGVITPIAPNTNGTPAWLELLRFHKVLHKFATTKRPLLPYMLAIEG